MMAYLHYPADETGYDFAASHPGITPGSTAWRSCRDGSRPMICCRASG
jgi:hypothetical protein